MSLSAIAAFTVLAILSVWAAQRLAAAQGRKPLPWMVAALSLGPLPLIPLALLRKK
jgi:hypothetical protein